MDPTAQLVEDYLDRRVPHLGVGADADPLFNGPEHTRLTRWGVTKMLAKHVQSLRRATRLRGRRHRHPARDQKDPAMHLLEAGVNLIYIRDLLGHADVSTTEIYARANAEAKRKAIESAYQSLTPEPYPTGQPTRTSSNGSTTPADRPRIMWPEPTPRHAHHRKHPSRPHNPAVHVMAEHVKVEFRFRCALSAG